MYNCIFIDDQYSHRVLFFSVTFFCLVSNFFQLYIYCQIIPPCLEYNDVVFIIFFSI